DFDAAVLRQTLFGDVKLRHDLDPRHDRVAELHRRIHDVVENPVDAVSNPELLLVWFDVDVARALLNSRHQHDVDESDCRWLFALLRERVGADFLELLQDLHLARVLERLKLFETFARQLERAGSAGLDPADGLRRRGIVAFDRSGDGGFRSDDRLDVVAGHELDVVHREDVRWIRHRDGESGAGATQRDDLILLRRIRRNQFDDGRVEFELGQVDGGNAVLLAEERGDLLIFDEPQLHEVVAEFAAFGLLLIQGLLQLLRRYSLLLYKEFANPDRHRR